MKKYIVEPATFPDRAALPPGRAAIPALKNALEDLRRIVADFAAAHPGQVVIGDGLWINTSLEIEATPEAAAQIARLPGIGKVAPRGDAPRPQAELLDSGTGAAPGAGTGGKEARLYDIHIKSADPTQSTDDFTDEQRRITAGVKRDIRRDLADSGLSSEFAMAAKRVPSLARSFQAYATPAALAVIRAVCNVEKIEPVTTSAWPLTRAL